MINGALNFCNCSVVKEKYNPHPDIHGDTSEFPAIRLIPSFEARYENRNNSFLVLIPTLNGYLINVHFAERDDKRACQTGICN